MEDGGRDRRMQSTTLHLQSLLPAGGSALAAGRGVAWVRTRGDLRLPLNSMHPGEKKKEDVCGDRYLGIKI